MTEPVSIAIVGAGNRGQTYADLAAVDGRAQIVAVADPDFARRDELADRHVVSADRRFDGWEALVNGPRLADAVFVATQDRFHYEPALALLDRGYHLLLEKPIAPTPEQCNGIVDAAERAGATFAVCHVLRYTQYTLTLKRLLDSGAIGELVSVEHLEPIGWWHFAHSFVRGNWRREGESAFMLLAKCVHDIDWLSHVVDRRARRVSSFGGLYHFRADQRPDDAADRCLDCVLQESCPYSAPKIYLPGVGNPTWERWPLRAVTSDRTTDGVLAALRDGPYGRCVYGCDNDVVDHQVVSIEYEGGVTASFTATAFTDYQFRKTRLFGTHGCIEGDGKLLDLLDFRTGRHERVPIPTADGPHGLERHGGGDAGLVRAFVDALVSGDPAAHLPDPQQALAAHHLTWAAEQARLTASVVDLVGTDRP
jgi:predicted dehydrogenase